MLDDVTVEIGAAKFDPAVNAAVPADAAFIPPLAASEYRGWFRPNVLQATHAALSGSSHGFRVTWSADKTAYAALAPAQRRLQRHRSRCSTFAVRYLRC